MSKEKVSRIIRDKREQIISTLSDLIAVPTENPPGKSYRECVDYLSERLSEWRIDHRIVSVPNEDFPRFSIIGTYGEGEESLHLHGHYDVVPVHSPEQFQPLVQKGRIFGRGSSDMKSGLITILFTLLTLKELGVELKGRIVFSFVPDEETGGRLGTLYLIERELLPPVRLGMLMPEPTSGAVWNANKGALTFQITIRGKTAHVGLAGEGMNAFEHMIEVAHSLRKLKRDVQKRKTKLRVSPPGAERSTMLIGGESRSGYSFNVVPERAFFTIDRRINPEENLEKARNEIFQVLNQPRKKGIQIEIDVLQEGESSFVSPETEVGQALKKSIMDVKGEEPAFELCPGVCEIRFFNNRGIPAYAYGPGLLEVSHGPDEYVREKDILDCIEIFSLTALRLLY